METAKTVLVVTNETEAAGYFRNSLRNSGHNVINAYNSSEVMKVLSANRVDMVLLDLAVSAPLLKRIRAKKYRTPVIIISAKNNDFDKVLCLEPGASDYVEMDELLSRVNAALERLDTHQNDDVIVLGELEIDTKKHTAKKNGTPIETTSKEYELLKFFMKNPGVAYTRQQLLEEIWGYGCIGETRTVDVHIRQLRKKIEDNAAKPEYIKTIRGTGYKMREV